MDAAKRPQNRSSTTIEQTSIIRDLSNHAIERSFLNTFEVHGRSGDRHARKRATTAGGNKRQTRRQATHVREEIETRGGMPESLDLFLQRARVHPLLTAAEEIELA